MEMFLLLPANEDLYSQQLNSSVRKTLAIHAIANRNSTQRLLWRLSLILRNLMCWYSTLSLFLMQISKSATLFIPHQESSFIDSNAFLTRNQLLSGDTPAGHFSDFTQLPLKTKTSFFPPDQQLLSKPLIQLGEKETLTCEIVGFSLIARHPAGDRGHFWPCERPFQCFLFFFHAVVLF